MFLGLTKPLLSRHSMTLILFYFNFVIIQFELIKIKNLFIVVSKCVNDVCDLNRDNALSSCFYLRVGITLTTLFVFSLQLSRFGHFKKTFYWMNFFTFTHAHVQAQGSKKVRNKWCQDIVVIRFLRCACFPVDKTPTKEEKFLKTDVRYIHGNKIIDVPKFIYKSNVRSHCTQTKNKYISSNKFKLLFKHQFEFQKISRLHLNRYCPLFV